LYQSTSPTVSYGPGVTLDVLPGDVNPVPLPVGVIPGMGVGALIVISRIARRRTDVALVHV